MIIKASLTEREIERQRWVRLLLPLVTYDELALAVEYIQADDPDLAMLPPAIRAKLEAALAAADSD